MGITMSQIASAPNLYKQYMLGKNAIQNKYDATVQGAERVLADEKNAANIGFDRANVNYGMLAEQLAQNGLSGSGFSDNLTRDAYAERQTGYSNAYKAFGDSIAAAEQKKADSELSLENTMIENKKALDLNYLADYEDIDENTSRQTLKNLIVAQGYSRQQADDMFKKAGLTPISEAEYNAIVGIEGGDSTPTPQTSVSPRFGKAFATLAANRDGEITADTLQALFNNVEQSGTEYDKIKLREILEGTARQNGMTINGYTSLADYLSKKYGLSSVVDSILSRLPQGTTATPGETAPGGAGGSATSEEEAFNLTANGFTISSSPKTGEGNNFEITYGDNTYRAELGKEVSLSDPANKGLAKAAQDAPNDTLFYYNGGIYAKFIDGEGKPSIWTVQRRALFYGESYRDFVDAVKQNAITSGSQTSVTYSFVKAEVVNGERFTMTDSAGNSYTLKSEGESTDENVRAAAEKFSDGGVFTLGNVPYIRIDYDNGYKVFRINDEKGDVKALVKSLSGTSTSDQKDAAQQALTNASKNVKVVSKDVGGTWDIMFGIGGNNITVKANNTEYKVQTGSQAPPEVAQAALAANVPQKSVFQYGGKLYLRDKEKFYELEERPNTGGGAYATLFDDTFDKVGTSGDSYKNSFTLKKVKDGDSFLNFKEQSVTEDFAAGDNLSFKDENGKIHRVTIEGEVSNVAPPSGVKDDTPFEANGSIYVRHNGKVYKLSSRMLYSNAYKSLLAKLKASSDK